jgi:glycosyltransferase involved in cell wall biosynthesis
MEAPLVSIGISFKNPGSYFRLALQSVFAQSFKDWELILVDDGSTDGSHALALNLRDRRVRAYSDGLCRNLNTRLNQMVRLARGKYFFRMDADDVMHPERVERQLAVLEQAGSSTVVGSAAYSVDSRNRVVGIRPAKRERAQGFAARHSFIHPTVAASREWFIENPYSEHFLYHRAQDAELWCRTAGKTCFIVMPDPLLFYRESDTFSFSNYLGTSMGLLNLIHQHARTKYEFGMFLTREIAKLWLTSACYRLGCIETLVNRRFKSIREAERTQAQSVLNDLANFQLLEKRSEALVA